MSTGNDLSYFTQIEGGVYGKPDGPPLEDIAALQEAVIQQQIAMAPRNPVVFNAGYGPNAPMWATQPGGPGVVATAGWTCQNSNSNGSPFPPYSTENIGFIPDWNDDGNPIGAGEYDMNQVVAYGDNNPLSQAPIGDGLLQFDDNQYNYNASGYDDSTPGLTEY